MPVLLIKQQINVSEQRFGGWGLQVTYAIHH